MYTGVQDTETAVVEVAANAREQIGLVACIDQHLQAFTDRGAARTHHRSVRADQA